MSIWKEFENLVSVEEMVSEQKAQEKKFEPFTEGTYTFKVESLSVDPNNPTIIVEYTEIDTGRKLRNNMFLHSDLYPQYTVQNIKRALTFLGKLTNTFLEYKSMERIANIVEYVGKYALEDNLVVEGQVWFKKNDTDKRYPQVTLKQSNYVTFDEDKVTDNEFDSTDDIMEEFTADDIEF